MIKRNRLLFPSYIILILVMFILPFYSADGYSIIKNTTSELGAQNTPNSWLMNLVFILLGLSILIQNLNSKGLLSLKIVLSIFSIALIFTGVFHHKPIHEVDYNLLEDNIHSFFATLVGFSFTIFAISTIFIFKDIKIKILSLIIALLSLGFSLLIFSFEDLRGLLQRLMFLITFLWLQGYFYINNERNYNI